MYQTSNSAYGVGQQRPAPPPPPAAASSSSSACKHSSYSIRNTSPPGADGIEECRTFDVFCGSCGKKLAKRYECISAIWFDTFEQAWVDQHEDLLRDCRGFKLVHALRVAKDLREGE